jgi:hypothetical protein
MDGIRKQASRYICPISISDIHDCIFSVLSGRFKSYVCWYGYCKYYIDVLYYSAHLINAPDRSFRIYFYILFWYVTNWNNCVHFVGIILNNFKGFCCEANISVASHEIIWILWVWNYIAMFTTDASFW